MSTLTTTALANGSGVRLDADFSDVLADVLVATRTRNDTGVTGTVRSSGPTQAMTAQYAQLNQNADFETNVTNWTALGGATLAQSSTQKHRGSFAMSLTTAAGAGPGAESEKETVQPGATYAYTAWVYSPSASTGMSAGINWYTSVPALISSTLPLVQANLAAGWNLLQGAAVAPPGAASATIVIKNVATTAPGAGLVFYLDECRLLSQLSLTSVTGVQLVGGQGTTYDIELSLDVPWLYSAAGLIVNGTWGIQLGTASAGPIEVPSLGRVWLKDPLAPANSISASSSRFADGVSPRSGFGFLGFGSQTHKANTTNFQVNNTPYPTAINRIRSSQTSTMLFHARSFADRDALITLLQPGTPLLLQVPSFYGEPDRYVSIADETIERIGQDLRRANRVFSLPFVSCLAPTGPAQGPVGARWMDQCQRYTTWGALAAGAAGTWDSFSARTNTSSWGTPDVGASYTLDGTATQFNVGSGAASIAVNALNTYFRARTGSLADADLFVTLAIGAAALTQPFRVGLTARFVDTANFYLFCLEFGIAGTVTPRIVKVVTGTPTTLFSGTAFAYAANSLWRVHAKLSGTSLGFSGWLDGSSAEPAAFQASGTDATFGSAGPFGPTAFFTTGNTNTLPYTISFDNFLCQQGATWTQVMDGVIV